MILVFNISLIDKIGFKCSFIEYDIFLIVVKDFWMFDFIK